MQSPPKPPDERERIAALRNLLLLDTPPERRFDQLTAYATAYFEVPIALVSLVDANRQWFKSRCGLGATETGRDVSFCGYTILQDGVMVIEDALGDPRFAENPLVVGEPRIRFYAGAPLTLPGGQRVGTFCLIDRIPRTLAPAAAEHLARLAAVTVQELQGIPASDEFLQERGFRAVDS
ncbi:MAG: GAF domain-containing protein [Gammaproteobacteria bacterium]